MTDKMIEIITEVLEIELADDFTVHTELAIDSINFVRIIITIEDSFDVEFDEMDLNIEAFRTINDFIIYVNRIKECEE